MVTEKEYMVNGKYMSAVALYGLSTDTKPTSVGNGSVFIAVDKIGSTEDPFIFTFDAANAKWYPEIESGD